MQIINQFAQKDSDARLAQATAEAYCSYATQERDVHNEADELFQQTVHGLYSITSVCKMEVLRF